MSTNSAHWPTLFPTEPGEENMSGARFAHVIAVCLAHSLFSPKCHP